MRYFLLVWALGAVVSQGAVSFNYTFENGTAGNAIGTAVDSSGNGLNGTSTGGTYSADVPSDGGNLSGNFVGDGNYITTSDSPLLHLQEFVLVMDFKPDSPYNPGGASPSTLLAKKIMQAGVFISNYNINYDPSTEGVTGQISWSAGNGLQLASADIAPLGVWTTVKLVLNRDVSGADDFFGLYINGVLVDSVTQEIPALGYTSGDLVIGAGNFGSGPGDTFRRNFDGYIDNVSLTAIPEPSQYGLLFTAIVGLAIIARRHK